MPDFVVNVQMIVSAPDIDRAMDWVEETLQDDDTVRSIQSMSACGMEQDNSTPACSPH